MSEGDAPRAIGGYEVLGELGRGSTGVVYRARHLALDRLVALKVVDAAELADSADAERFLRGARAAARLDHPHLVRIYEVGRDGDLLFVAMTLVEGESLAARLAKSGPMAPSEAAACVRRVAAAVAHAHGKGVLHRALTPEAVLLDRTGLPRVTGFGMARLADAGHSLTAADESEVSGFSAPESVRGVPASASLDVYGLGAILYAALTGRPPVEARTPGELAELLGRSTIAPPSKHGRRIPRSVETVCLRCLETEPSARYASAAEVAAALDASSGESSSPSVKSVATSPKTAGPAARRRWVVALVSLVALVGASAAAWSLLHRGPRSSEGVPPSVVAPFDATQARTLQEAWARHLDEPVEWENSIGMRFRLVPPGEFDMGATQEEVDEIMGSASKRRVLTPQEKEWVTSARPRHRVRLTRPFHCGVHEVTVGQFARFVSETKYETDADKQQQAWSLDTSTGTGKMAQEYRWSNPGYPQSPSHPVVLVSYDDAAAFCKWLSQAEGRTYRLLTEAEWEFCARAGSTASACSEANIDLVRGYANVPDDMLNGRFPYDPTAYRMTWNDGHPFASPVGSFRPNAFGLHDVLGNAWEATADWFDPTYYASTPLENPPGPEQGKACMWRGGAHDSWCWLEAFNPFIRFGVHDRHSPFWVGGFRVMLESPAAAGTGQPLDARAPSSPASRLQRAKALCDQAEPLPVTEEIGGGWVVELWEQAATEAKEAAGADSAAVEAIVRRAEEGRARAADHLARVRKEVPLWRAIQAAEATATARPGPQGQICDVSAGAEACARAFAAFGYEPGKTADRVLVEALADRPQRIREQVLVGLQQWEVYADAAGQSATANQLRASQALLDNDSWRERARSARANPGGAGTLPLLAEIAKNPLLAETHDLAARVLLTRNFINRPEAQAFFQESSSRFPAGFWPNLGQGLVLAEKAKNLTGTARTIQVDLALATLTSAKAARPPSSVVDAVRSRWEKEVGSPDVDRALAEWVLKQGGRVLVRRQKYPPWQGETGIDDATALPSEPFRVICLSLTNRPIGDADLNAIPKVPLLDEANLEGAKVGDAGVRRLLRDFPSVTRLNLEGTVVTDGILDELHKLTVVYLRRTAVNAAAIAKLVENAKSVEILHESLEAAMPSPPTSRLSANGKALRVDWRSSVEVPISLDLRESATIEAILARSTDFNHGPNASPVAALSGDGGLWFDVNRHWHMGGVRGTSKEGAPRMEGT